MPGLAQLIGLAVVVVLLAVIVTLGWRLARWSVRTRQILAYRTAVTDLAGRSGAALAAIAERVDGARRAAVPASEIVPDLAAARTAITALGTEARALRGPAGTEAITGALGDELERALRALESVEHGCELIGEERGREHDPEAQTAVKRGYLNLVHAQESIGEQVRAAEALPVSIPRFLARRQAE